MSVAALHAHLKEGVTRVCQCWTVTRRDGVTFGFTDHDRDLTFDGIRFQADSGMSAKALAGTTGPSVDNSEAVGLLRADILSEEDIAAGRYDGAEVVNWLVRWDDVSARQVRFRGTLGEITRTGGAFSVDLRGLAEALNVPVGRSYLRTCSAVLGDSPCGVNILDPLYSTDGPVSRVKNQQTFRVATDASYPDRWFEQGMLEVLTGPARGLRVAIKTDRKRDSYRKITLWDTTRTRLEPGDTVRIVAGCDKRAETCRERFDNIVNFQGFPDMPGDDWQATVPRADGTGTGGSLVR